MTDVLTSSWCLCFQNQRPSNRKGHSAVVLGSAMLVYGGFMDIKGSLQEFWSLNLSKFFQTRIKKKEKLAFLISFLVISKISEESYSKSGVLSICVCLGQIQRLGLASAVLIGERPFLGPDTITPPWPTRTACSCLEAWRVCGSKGTSGGGTAPITHGPAWSECQGFLSLKLEARLLFCEGFRPDWYPALTKSLRFLTFHQSHHISRIPAHFG